MILQLAHQLRCRLCQPGLRALVHHRLLVSPLIKPFWLPVIINIVTMLLEESTALDDMFACVVNRLIPPLGIVLE